MGTRSIGLWYVTYISHGLTFFRALQIWSFDMEDVFFPDGFLLLTSWVLCRFLSWWILQAWYKDRVAVQEIRSAHGVGRYSLLVVFGHMTSISILLISQKVGSLGPISTHIMEAISSSGCYVQEWKIWFEAYWQLQWPVAGVHWPIQYLFAATFWFLLHQRDGSLSGELSCSRWFYHNNSRMRRLWLY